jgi:hypothetical protein
MIVLCPAYPRKKSYQGLPLNFEPSSAAAPYISTTVYKEAAILFAPYLRGKYRCAGTKRGSPLLQTAPRFKLMIAGNTEGIADR